ncbi:MAG: DUF302 domain-containing protein [SAR324 cluster bacterium]|nr:DUF302 domain-containing protein [SAR324 cluster bacterium]
MGQVNKNTKYGYSREVDLSYEEAVAKVTESLKEQGFGILTEIDVKATLKKKIDKDINKYVILGACNPNLAFQALTAEIDIGLLLPCNVTVYESPDNGKTVVSVLDPELMVTMTGNEALNGLAQEAKKGVIAALEAV